MKNLEFNHLLFEAIDMNPFSEDELAMVMGGGDESTEFVFSPQIPSMDVPSNLDELFD